MTGLWLGLPADVKAGLTAQGLTAQGLTAQGLTAQGLTAQGLTAQGLTAQGLTAQGLTAQGLTAQGLTAQGLTAQGLTAQGLTAQGVALLGTDVVAAELKGVTIGSVEIRGTEQVSPIVTHELTTGPLISAGSGDYISVGGGSAVNHFAVAHLLDANGNAAEDLDLFIAGERPDPIPNLFHRVEAQKNDVTLYSVYYFHKWSGQWFSLCPFNPQTNDASAIAIPEDLFVAPNKFIFACTASGVASKCARNWGYRPWQTTTAWVFSGGDWVEQTFPLKDYYDACKLAARAGYCQDGKSFTQAGTLVDLYDTRQIIWPNTIENPFNQSNPDSLWMMAQEYFVSFDPSTGPVSMKMSALQRTRYRELSPVGDCANLGQIDRLEHDHFEDGRWANPLANTPRIEVFSPNYCTHKENQVGEALPWDCSPCTKAVCRNLPQCCTSSPGSPGWTAACTTERLSVCQDVPGPACDDAPGAPRPCWVPGKVWPTDVPLDSTRSLKFLQGAGGAVERVDGISTGASAATVIGWACDPEWPGAAVAVDLYGGAPRGQVGSVPLGRAWADLALGAPLVHEVSAACDGTTMTGGRHGFSFTLPAGLSGNVFAYAVDAATADGPAAPPSLLRNGIVHVPTCAHSEHAPGEALDASCSSCAALVCGKSELADCCVGGWTDSCAAAAQSCTTGDWSATTNGHAFAAATTGWIEAPATGSFTFESASQPSRLFINGKKVFDWWEGTGTRQGSIELAQGGKYHLRWDRFQAAPSTTGPGPGLTWQVPGTVGQAAIPAALLYKLAPGLGTGLQGQYVPTAGVPVFVVDPTIDFPRTTQVPEGMPAPFSVTWQGEIVAPATDTYTFYVVGAASASLTIDGTSVLPADPGPNGTLPACSHDICDIGEKLAASTLTQAACNPCVDLICNPASPTADPYCCNGGYLSYYSSEPEWDAKCVAEVKSVCGIDCKRPPPNPIGTQRTSGGIPLQAGVRHRIVLSFSNVTSLDAKLQLLWASATQNKEVIPSTSLFPGGTVASQGAGLNLVTFATQETSSGTVADLDKLVASGSVPDLSAASAVGASGLPLINVLAATDDASAAIPSLPSLAQPAFNDHIFGNGGDLAIIIKGLGGVQGGSVTVTVDGAPGTTLLPIDGDGNFGGTVATGGPTPGPRTMRLVQRNYPGPTCAAPALCAQSPELVWKFVVDTSDPALAPAPTILSPRDPTASLDPSITSFLVVGRGIPNVDLDVVDKGGPGANCLPGKLTVGADGNFSGTITLTAGTLTNANPGWHKLEFSQGGGKISRVFISVGIQPPTVEFPRTGAALDCTHPEDRRIDARGTFPYGPADFGPLFFTEETGTIDVRGVAARQVTVGPPVTNPDGSQSFPFDARSLQLGPGKHLLYFFQLPPLDPAASRQEALAHVRGFASIASTPKSRIEINVPPPRIPAPFDNRTVVEKNPGDRVLGTPLPVPGQVIPCGPLATAPHPNCALPHADVNIKVGPRLFTVRADATGGWRYKPVFPYGFNELTVTQVVDSIAGGGWSQSCPSDGTFVGVGTLGQRPEPIVPGDITVDATSKSGTVVHYKVDVYTADLTAVKLTCLPESGALFPIGTTDVRCVAMDDVTKALGANFFRVHVIDGAPTIKVPPDGITAEATDALGAMLSYDITATDVVSGKVPVLCTPSAPPGSPALFLLDQDTTVLCEATDESMQTASASFVVRVRDTTPPTLCDLPDIRVNANRPGGALVNFATCAKDLVDGKVTVICDHPSGSFFPLGKTPVRCGAVDSHGNKSALSRFTVTVGDVQPPLLIVPGNLTVIATKRTGAIVTYTVTATDDSDPKPKVSCKPPSGALFPLGTTTVACVATDDSGNQSQASFKVRVLVAWSGLLFPLQNNGGSRIVRGLPLPVRFRLTDASAGIGDLQARLYVAPLNTQGLPGKEKPAVGLPPGVGNLFHSLPLLDEYALLMDTLPLKSGASQLRIDLGDGESHTVRITTLF